MENQVFNDYNVDSGSQADIVAFASQPITSPRLEREAASMSVTDEGGTLGTEEDANPKKLFSFKAKKPEAENTAEFIDNLDEDAINEEMEDIDEADYQLAADLFITFLDYAFEKVLNWFFNKKTVAETPAQKESLRHMKSLTKKVIMKWGVKFKIEFLLVMLMVMYFYARFKDAVPVDDKRPAKKTAASSITVLEDSKPLKKPTKKPFGTPKKETPKSAADILDDVGVKEEEIEEAEIEEEEENTEEVKTEDRKEVKR